MSDIVVSASCYIVLFDFFAVHEIRSILKGATFLLPPISFVTLLKLFRPHIHTSEWVQISIYSSTPGLFFLCESRCIYMSVQISFSWNSFFFDIHAISVLLCPSLDIKVPIVFALILLIKMLICRHSLLLLMTVTSVLLLFNSNPFFLLSSSTNL